MKLSMISNKSDKPKKMMLCPVENAMRLHVYHGPLITDVKNVPSSLKRFIGKHFWTCLECYATSSKDIPPD